MAGLTPYLRGTARAALSFYAQVFGGGAELHTFAEFGRSDGPRAGPSSMTSSSDLGAPATVRSSIATGCTG